MSYKLYHGSGSISINYDTRKHLDETFTVHTSTIADFKISKTKKKEEYDLIFQQAKKIVIELNRLNESLKRFNNLSNPLIIQ